MSETATPVVEELESIAIRFAGDSGDGMQLTGTQFTNTSAVFGNDISTMPDFPAEIRAPAGTLAGVSGFQVHFSSQDILTPGDAPQVLIAMNPAALKASLPELEWGTELFGPLLQTEEILVEPLVYRDFALEVPTGPGLGVELDMDKVEHLRRDGPSRTVTGPSARENV